MVKPNQSVEDFVKFLMTIGNIFGVTSVLLNVLFVVTIHFIKDKGSAFYHYIQNLAIADIFAAITFLVTEHWPHWLTTLIDPKEHYVLAHGLGYLFRSLPWMFFTAYLLTLCCLTFNQFIAVCKPLRYSDLVTPRAVNGSLIGIWSISSLQLAIPIITFSVALSSDSNARAYQFLMSSSYYETHVWMGLYTFTILLNIMLNAVTYLTIKQLKKRRENEGGNMDRSSIAIKQEAFITVTLLLCASIFCRLPFPVMGIASYNIDITSSGVTTVILIDSIKMFLLYANFVVDPIIIACRTKDMKTTLRTFILVCRRKHKCCQQHTEENSTTSNEQRNLFSMNSV